MSHAIDITTLQRAVASVDKEIKYSPLTMGYERLQKLGINVLTDMEYENIFYRGLIRGGNAFAYNANMDPDAQKMGKLGAIKQRVMKTEIVKALIPDNINAYREVEPVGDGQRIDATNAPVTMARIDEIKKTFVNDLVRNVFVGKRNENTHDGYHAINGLFQCLDEYIGKGEISIALKNMVAMPEITDSMDDATVYNILHKWRTQWNYNFQENLEEGGNGVLWYLSKSIYDRFVEGYKASYKYQNLENVHQAGYKFIGWDGITFMPTTLMGEGSRMFVTIADNLDFGLNTKSTEAGVKVTENFKKPDEIFYHIMSCVGTRVRYIEPSCFICNDHTNTIISGLGVDYEQATVYATSNDTTLGTVSADKPTADVVGGTIITLTATATSTGEFDKWSDGCTTAQRTIIAPGYPISYQAIFKAKVTE